MNTAAFWIVSGERFLLEGQKSAESLKRHMPDVKRILITPEIYAGKNVFDLVCRMAAPRPGEPWYACNIANFDWAAHNLHAPRVDPTPDVLINLDVDTFVVQPFDDLLQLLNRFDIVGTHAPARYTSRTVQPIPEAFCELNIGMVAFRNSDKMRRVIREWHVRYDRHQDVYGDNDQASLRETLWTTEEDVRIWVAPPEYHFRLHSGGFARYAVKLLHGRSRRFPIEEVARRVNKAVGMRTYRKGEL